MDRKEDSAVLGEELLSADKAALARMLTEADENQNRGGGQHVEDE